MEFTLDLKYLGVSFLCSITNVSDQTFTTFIEWIAFCILHSVSPWFYSRPRVRLSRLINFLTISRLNNIFSIFFFCCGAATQRESWPPHSWGFQITHNDAPQSVELLWTSDQLVAETSTWQYSTLTTNIHALGGIRNPRSQQASSRRHTP